MVSFRTVEDARRYSLSVPQVTLPSGSRTWQLPKADDDPNPPAVFMIRWTLEPLGNLMFVFPDGNRQRICLEWREMPLGRGRRAYFDLLGRRHQRLYLAVLDGRQTLVPRAVLMGLEPELDYWSRRVCGRRRLRARKDRLVVEMRYIKKRRRRHRELERMLATVNEGLGEGPLRAL
jgi:hypothetical protein